MSETILAATYGPGVVFEDGSGWSGLVGWLVSRMSGYLVGGAGAGSSSKGRTDGVGPA